MKRFIALTILLFAVGSCAVQKKEYYIFSWYVPKHNNRQVPLLNADNTTAASWEKQKLRETLCSDSVQSVPPEQQALNDNIQLSNSTPNIKKQGIHERDTGVETIREGTNTLALKLADTSAAANSQPDLPRKNGNKLLLIAAAILGLGIYAAMRLLKPVVTRITRWAKANPATTQNLIAGIHVPLLGMGAVNGFNLHQMGYDITDPFLYGMSAATLLGFLTVPYVAKDNIIALPKHVNRQRLSFLGITLSSLLLMTGLGNKIPQAYPDSMLTQTMGVVDNSIYLTANSAETDPLKVKEERAKEMNDRQKKASGAGVASGVAIFFLVILACAGICLTIGGAIALSSGEPLLGILGLILGPLLTWYSIKLIDKESKKNKARKAAKPVNK